MYSVDPDLKSISEGVVESEVLRETVAHEDDGAGYFFRVGQKPRPEK